MPNAALTTFLGSLNTLNYTRRRMEGLFDDDQIVLRDLYSVYEALFLRGVTSFEAFLESLFVSILRKQARFKRGRVVVRMEATSAQALMDILLQGQNYMTWLPFESTLKRAEIYLRDGKPFSELDEGDRSIIKIVHTIRNAIAHKSPHAVALFHSKVINNLVLLPRERNPAGFLRSPLNDGRTRFENYMIELGRIATSIS